MLLAFTLSIAFSSSINLQTSRLPSLQEFGLVPYIRDLYWNTTGSTIYDNMTRNNLSAWRTLVFLRSERNDKSRQYWLERLKYKIGNNLDYMPPLLPVAAMAEMAMCHP
jgi:hypothetical protein